MQHCFCFEAVDRMLQDIRSNDCLFGGLPVIMGGDFAQILPVVRRATIVGACIQRSYIWPRLSLLFLRQNMGLFHDENSREFGTWLQELSHNPQWRNRISLPPFLRQTSQMDDFYNMVFPLEELPSIISSSLSDGPRPGMPSQSREQQAASLQRCV